MPRFRLQADFGFEDRDQAIAQDLEAEIHLLADGIGDALLVRLVHDGAHLGAEHAQFLRPRALLRQLGHVLHQLHAVFGIVHPLVDLQEGDDALARKPFGDRHAFRVAAFHGLFEQDRANHLVTGKGRAFHDAAAHFVDLGEHLVFARILVFADAIPGKRLGRGAARLIQRRDKSVARCDLRLHLFEIHGRVRLPHIRMRCKALSQPEPGSQAVLGPNSE